MAGSPKPLGSPDLCAELSEVMGGGSREETTRSVVILGRWQDFVRYPRLAPKTQVARYLS